MFCLKDGTFVWCVGATSIVHFDACGDRIRTFELPLPPPPSLRVRRDPNREQVIEIKHKTWKRWAVAEMSDHSFGVLYDYKRTELKPRNLGLGRFTFQFTNLVVFDHVNGSLLYDKPLGSSVSCMMTPKAEPNQLYTLNFEEVSLWKIVDGGRGFAR